MNAPAEVGSTDSWGRWEGERLICEVRLTPRASANTLSADAGRLRLKLTSPPVGGRANRQAIELLAVWFGVARRQVRLLRGERGRDKLFGIDRPTRVPPELEAGLPQRRGG